MSCPKRTSLQWHAHVRSKDSCLNLSKSLRCSLVTLESWSLSNKPSMDSRKSCPESTITYPRSLSTWSETFQRSSKRPRGWQLKPLETKNSQSDYILQFFFLFYQDLHFFDCV